LTKETKETSETVLFFSFSGLFGFSGYQLNKLKKLQKPKKRLSFSTFPNMFVCGEGVFSVAKVLFLAGGNAFSWWFNAHHLEVVIYHDLYKLQKGDAGLPV